MFVETLVSTCLDLPDLEEHLKKSIGDNIRNIPVFLLIYGNSSYPQELWKKIKSYFQLQFPDLGNR